jgi:hypothetical protein
VDREPREPQSDEPAVLEALRRENARKEALRDEVSGLWEEEWQERDRADNRRALARLVPVWWLTFAASLAAILVTLGTPRTLIGWLAALGGAVLVASGGTCVAADAIIGSSVHSGLWLYGGGALGVVLLLIAGVLWLLRLLLRLGP